MESKIRVVIAMGNEDSLISTKKLLESLEKYKITGMARSGNEVIGLCSQFQPDIVIMNVNIPVINGYEAAIKITEVFPYIGIILIGTIDSMDTLLKAMRSGASDFLEPPLTSVKLENALSLLYKNKQQQKKSLLSNPLIIPQRRPKVISVFSSKGGVGKTVVATNIATALKLQTREDILLLDLDLQFGDVADMLNLNPKFSIIDLVNDIEKIEKNEYMNYIVTHHSGINILNAPRQPEQADLVGEREIRKLIPLFLNVFDYIVIDLPPLFNSITVGALELSDQILLITTMEIPTLKNVKESINVFDKLGISDDKITLVLNRFSDNNELKLDDIKNFLNIQKIYCINDASDLVSTSINAGEPMILKYKTSGVSKQILSISKTLTEYNPLNNKAKKESIFKRIFKKGD